MKIKQINNGFVYTNDWEEKYAFKTLTDLAVHVEGPAYAAEPSPSLSRSMTYAPFKGILNLRDIRQLALDGKKIEAIKEMRSLLNHAIGLKEAKEMIEVLVLDQ